MPELLNATIFLDSGEWQWVRDATLVALNVVDRKAADH